MISKQYLDECFKYDKDLNLLVWKERPQRHFKTKLAMDAFNKCFSGKVAGNIKEDGRNSYYRISINGRNNTCTG